MGVQYSLARKLLQGRPKKEFFIGGNEKYDVESTFFQEKGIMKKALKSEVGEGLSREDQNFYREVLLYS